MAQLPPPALLAGSLLLLACGPESPQDAAPGGTGPSAQAPVATAVVLISLDTVRADHMSLYGYGRPTTPRLEEFARGATVFRRARSTAPWTLPSHASMFTGLYPREHGARTFKHEQEGAKYDVRVSSLGPEALTLAEVLAATGYRTGAVTANEAFLDARFGLDQGFEHYENERGDVGEVNARALAWLDAHLAGGAERPFFLFLNYMDTHRPYNCAPRPGFLETKTNRKALLELIPYVLQGQEPPEGLLQLVVDQYDTALANLDEGLGALFDALRERGLFEDALIVITSDHGEFLGEHDLIEHSKDVYEAAVNIPLIVKAPGQSGPAEDPDWISLAHLPGLVLQHVPVPEEVRQALSPHWPRREIFLENYYTRAKDNNQPWWSRFDRVRQVVYEDRFKYISSSDGADELYDLEADGGESTNLLETQPAAAEVLRRRLAAWLGTRGEAAPGEVSMDADLERKLAELGYGGRAAPEPEPTPPPPGDR